MQPHSRNCGRRRTKKRRRTVPHSLTCSPATATGVPIVGRFVGIRSLFLVNCTCDWRGRLLQVWGFHSWYGFYEAWRRKKAEYLGHIKRNNDATSQSGAGDFEQTSSSTVGIPHTWALQQVASVSVTWRSIWFLYVSVHTPRYTPLYMSFSGAATQAEAKEFGRRIIQVAIKADCRVGFVEKIPAT
eukprot:GHVU01087557.1.p1 GENE.GHVU01087557.1~~GHVU01087557.1.p1  ORF type:complete len:186 (+),score=2.13 GHVU01087557.1:845-1402(+)